MCNAVVREWCGERRERRLPFPLLPPQDDVTCIATDSSGDLVAAGGTGHTPELLVFKASTGALVSRFTGFHKRRVVCMAFSPNGREVCAGVLRFSGLSAVCFSPVREVLSPHWIGGACRCTGWCGSVVVW